MKTELLFVLITSIVEVISYDNTNIADLPADIFSDLLAILKQIGLESRGGCEDFKESDINLLLYTRNNTNSPIYLNITNPVEIDQTKNVKLLIHGWLTNPSTFVPEMKDAYLDRYDSNVISLDWSKFSLQFYSLSVCYLPKVAELVGNFLCLLEQEFNIPVNSIHVIGHSLGGQMSGFVGKSTIDKCGQQLGRITGLDPAGPLFQGLPSSQRLDKSDAMFVDVIHTNAGLLGYWGNCGHADFYVNCGTIQLGCPNFAFTPESIRDLPVSIVTCHHMRSVNYMTESISDAKKFQAKECKTCPITCVTNFLFSSRTGIVMGEDCTEFATGGYVLATNNLDLISTGTELLTGLIPVNSVFKNILSF